MKRQNRLKVLFLPAWYPSEVNPVAGVFVREHARAASTYSDVVVLYAYPDPSPERRHLPSVSEVSEEGIRTIRVRYGGSFRYWWRRITGRGRPRPTASETKATTVAADKALSLPRVMVDDVLCYRAILSAFRGLVRQGWKPDIIHAHVYSAAVPAVMLGKLYRIPVVVTEHFSGFPRHLLTRTERLKARFAMNRAQMVLPVSDYLRGHIESYGIRNEFRVVPCVVGDSVFVPPLPTDEGDTNRQFKLLFVGNLVPVKGLPCLLKALSQVKEKRQDFVLDIVGGGPNRAEYEELASRLGLERMVRFHGPKPKQEVARLMRECAFLVQPSLQETFGVVYIEAMACGKPVIATNAGGPREFVSEDVGILVPPEDTGALRDAIEYMLDNHQRYSSEKIARHARERFSYEAVGRMLDEVYRAVAKARSNW